LTAYLSRHNIHVPPPQGAFYLFPDFRQYRRALTKKNIRTSTELCDRLLTEAGVAILPGEVFGRPPEELTARLSYVDFDGARALAAAEQVPPHEPLSQEFLQRYCGHTIEAVQKICEWLEGDKE
jgi:aspartate aminotransferase